MTRTPPASERYGAQASPENTGTGSLTAAPANEQDRAQVFDLCLEVQEATGVKVEVASADQGYTGAQTALEASVELIVVKRPEAVNGFILLPRLGLDKIVGKYGQDDAEPQ